MFINSSFTLRDFMKTEVFEKAVNVKYVDLNGNQILYSEDLLSMDVEKYFDYGEGNIVVELSVR